MLRQTFKLDSSGDWYEVEVSSGTVSLCTGPMAKRFPQIVDSEGCLARRIEICLFDSLAREAIPIEILFKHNQFRVETVVSFSPGDHEPLGFVTARVLYQELHQPESSVQYWITVKPTKGGDPDED